LEEHGIHQYSFPWTGSFSDAHNFSLAQTTADWILILDADEELATNSGVKLRQLVANGEADGYFIKIVSYLGDERWDESCSGLVFRLFRNRQEYRFHGAVHEQIADVILERNSWANIQITGGIVILHHGYLNKQVNDKDKINRNLTLMDPELRQEPGNRPLLYHYGVELYRSGRFLEAVAALLRAADGLDPQTSKSSEQPHFWASTIK
jgi:glycosyltransferase involved in cell wall biosynthesis